MNTVPDNKVLHGDLERRPGSCSTTSRCRPEGCELKVFPIGPLEQIGIPDDQWPKDPQGIAELLERMDQIEPVEMTPGGGPGHCCQEAPVEPPSPHPNRLLVPEQGEEPLHLLDRLHHPEASPKPSSSERLR